MRSSLLILLTSLFALCAYSTTLHASPTSWRPTSFAETQLYKHSTQTPPIASQRIRDLFDQATQTNADDWSPLAAVYLLQQPAEALQTQEAITLYQNISRLLAPNTSLPSRLAQAHLALQILRNQTHLQPELDPNPTLQKLGFTTSWHIAGPFDNSNMTGFARSDAPEGLYDPNASFPTKISPSSWRPLVFQDAGYHALSEAINPPQSSTVYAATTVSSTKAQEAILRLGVDGAYKVWVNGTLVGIQTKDLGASLDRDAIPVQLKRGTNTVLIKVAGENRPALGFMARWTLPDGTPLTLPQDPAKLPAKTRLASPDPKELPTPTSIWTRAAQHARQAPQDQRAALLIKAAVIARTTRPLDPKAPWRDLLQEALPTLARPTNPAQAQRNASLVTTAASLLNRHWERLPLLQNAARLSSDSPWNILQALEEQQKSVGIANAPTTLAALDSLNAKYSTKARPTLLPRLLQARILNAQGHPQLALEALKPCLEHYPQNVALLSLARTLYESLRQDHKALQIGYQIYMQRRDSTMETLRVARSLLRSAKPEEALKLTSASLKHHPESLSILDVHTQALFQTKQHQKALAALDTALRNSPRNASILRIKGQLFEQLQDTNQALATYQTLLSIRPEDRETLERVRALQPRAQSYETPYLLSIEDLHPSQKDAAQHAGQDYYYLASQHVIQVSPNGQSSRTTQNIIHVLTNEGAKAWSNDRVYYSPGEERVEIVAVRVHKADGTLSEVYNRSDYDAGRGEGNLYYQRRFAYITVSNLEPGDSIEYTTRSTDISPDNFREGYYGDIWFFQASVDIEHARYVLLTPNEMTIHTRLPKLPNLQHKTEAITLQNKPYTARVVQAKNIDRVRTDDSMPGRSESYEYVLVSTYKDWNDVGTWWWNLIEDQLILNNEIKKTVREITKGLKTDMEKIKAIHNWFVKNTRYVGIEFGVHGWKPYRTTLAFQRRFGDCKDKASLTKVMLEAAGIKANMVLIRTRALGDVSDTPANLAIFNHAISYVPKYDLFLDGTAEFSGTRELPFGDQGALAVIVADGGKTRVVRTPVQPPSLNTHVRVLEVDLSKNPTITKGELTASGADAVYYRNQFDSPDKRRETLERMLARTFPGARLKDASFDEVTSLEKPVRVTFTLEDGGFVKQLGDTQALFPAGREIYMLARYGDQSSRDQDLMLGIPYTLTERVRYRLPSNRSAPTLPSTIERKSPFGSYSIRVTRNGDIIESEVTYSLAKERISKADYPAFRSWLKDIDSAINRPIMLTDPQ